MTETAAQYPAVVPPQAPSAPKTKQPFTGVLGIQPKTIEEAMAVAKIIADSDFVPKDYRGKPGNVLVAWEMSNELGIPPMQGLQGIAVINGRPSMWGDLALALVQGRGLLAEFKEYDQGQAFQSKKGWCRIRRKGDQEAAEFTFSEEDAKRAKLWNKEGTWTTYPGRMLQMRARAFGLRDKFADVLKGVSIVEEVADYEPGAAAPAAESVIVRPRRASEVKAAAEASPAVVAAALKGPKPLEAAPVKAEGKRTVAFVPESLSRSHLADKEDGAPTEVFVMRSKPASDAVEATKYFFRDRELASIVKAAVDNGIELTFEVEERDLLTWVVRQVPVG